MYSLVRGRDLVFVCRVDSSGILGFIDRGLVGRIDSRFLRGVSLRKEGLVIFGFWV